MPKYRYNGEAPCYVGSALVNPGDTVDASFSPGKRFTLLEESALKAAPEATAFPAAEDFGEGGRKGRKTTIGGGES